MRVAYVSAEYPKVSHTFIWREVEALRRRGVTVDTYTIRRTPPEGLLTEADRAADAQTWAVLPTTARHLLGAHARCLVRNPGRYLATLGLSLSLSAPGVRNRVWQAFYFAEAALLACELRRRGTDHVHAHFVNVASWVALLASELCGGSPAWSFTMHGPLEFDEVTLHGLPAKIERAEFVACISDFARAQLMRLTSPERWGGLHVVRCGLEASAVTSRKPASGVASMEILTVGRLAPMKGFSVLLDAMAELGRAGVAARLVVVGDGPERPKLEAQTRQLELGSRVHFAGALGTPEVAACLAAADVFCLPSFAEGVPVVLMEAMQAGLPVVATRVMGIPELVDEELSGLLVPPGRSEPLAAALARLAGDAPLRQRLGAAGAQTVRERFDVDDSAARLTELFAAACLSRAAARR
jgi:glycosyltransferase involved in cell wall biosynthesis